MGYELFEKTSSVLETPSLPPRI